MAEVYQFIRQPRNHSLGATIEFRRNGLGQRSYLRDTHTCTSSFKPNHVLDKCGGRAAAPYLSQFFVVSELLRRGGYTHPERLRATPDYVPYLSQTPFAAARH
ncbi:hypothetical protein [Reyranella sp.]|uniref:hypothetical protein n=1 Tax=Reyranella sp. TaxID=1929291 RepID=UPI003D12F833